jgi:hypothetical protein
MELGHTDKYTTTISNHFSVAAEYDIGTMEQPDASVAEVDMASEEPPVADTHFGMNAADWNRET